MGESSSFIILRSHDLQVKAWGHLIPSMWPHGAAGQGRGRAASRVTAWGAEGPLPSTAGGRGSPGLSHRR